MQSRHTTHSEALHLHLMDEQQFFLSIWIILIQFFNAPYEYS